MLSYHAKYSFSLANSNLPKLLSTVPIISSKLCKYWYLNWIAAGGVTLPNVTAGIPTVIMDL